MLTATGTPALGATGSGPRPAPRTGPGLWVLTLLLAPLVGAACVAAAGRLHLPDPSQAPEALTNLASAAALAVLLVLGASRWYARSRTGLLVASLGVAALAGALLAIPLQGTAFYLGGVSVDQSFRLQYFTRMASTASLRDMNYLGVAPYYPAGWFWVGGRLADLSGASAWQAYKPYAVGTMAFTGALLHLSWSALVGRRRGLAVAVLTVVVGTRYGATEPYSWCTAAMVPVLAVVALRASRAGVREGWRRLVLLGVGLGAAACAYTLYAGFAALVVALLLAAPVAAALRARRPPRDPDRATGLGAALAGTVRRLLVVAPLSALVALLVWFPYVRSVVTGAPSGHAAAPRFLPAGSASFPFPMLEASAWGVVMAVGAVALVAMARRSDVVAALAATAALVYAWYALSTLSLLARTTLLSFRLLSVLVAVLSAAAVLGAAAATPAVLGWVRRAALLGAPEAAAPGPRALGWGAAVAAAAVVLAMAQSAPLAEDAEVQLAYTDDYPTGVDARGVRDTSADGAWAPQLRAAIAAGTGAPPTRTVVLSTWYELLSFTPYWGYEQSTPHYANPLGQYDARRLAVEGWARASSPQDLLERMGRSPGRAPDALVLRRQADGYHVRLCRDVFPADPNVQFYDAVFDPSLFSAAAGWASRDVGPFVVLTRSVA